MGDLDKNSEEAKSYTRAIIGAAYQVHSQLGSGFSEGVYQEALAIEFEMQDIPYMREALFQIVYKGKLLNSVYRVDFLCYDNIVVEIKALTALGSGEQSQLLTYLKASGKQLGLLLNFGSPSVQIKRLVT